MTNGGLVDPELVVRFEDGGPDGMTEDGNGRYWLAQTNGDRIDLVDLEIGVVDSVSFPQHSMPTNVCRDHDGDGLYVTAGLAGALLHLVPEETE